MNDIDISLKYENGMEIEEENLFFEYHKVILEDLRRISMKVVDCTDSEKKNKLLSNLNKLIDDLDANRTYAEFLTIFFFFFFCIHGNYLIFSYYKTVETSELYTEKPSIIIITRDMKNIYFIDEIEVLIQNVEEYEACSNKYLDYSRYYVEFFRVRGETVSANECTLESYTNTIFYDSFNEIESIVKKIEKMFDSNINKKSNRK